MLKALKSFDCGSAPGPSGLRAEHLLQVVANPEFPLSSQLLECLADFLSFLGRGDCPYDLAPYLISASLIPLAKKAGGVRPIAVGEVYRKLVGKCMCKRQLNM